MRTFSAGPLRIRATGGTDHNGGGAGPAILLCHGFGAPGDDLVSLHRVVPVPPGTRWFFPEATAAVDVGYGATGRAWWPIDMLRLVSGLRTSGWRALVDEEPAGLSAAREGLEACLTSLIAEHDVRPEALVVGGFSQGAMLATEVALHARVPFAGLALLSGTLLAQTRWREAASSLRGLEVFQSHGREDPILPFAAAEALRDILTKAGATVDFVPFRGGHEIPALVIDGLARFVRARLPVG